MLVHYKITLI